MSLFIEEALANAAPAVAATSAQPNPYMPFIMLGLMVIIFYFLLWRPQSKRNKEQKELIEGLSAGDEVVLSGGLLGKILKVEEQYAVLELAKNVEVKIQKSAIASTLPKGTLKAI
ncbi:MAG: preprotein translocase subunit YajC [Gammaproteobacteria bacterium]